MSTRIFAEDSLSKVAAATDDLFEKLVRIAGLLLAFGAPFD
jgi:hypothetical protein